MWRLTGRGPEGQESAVDSVWLEEERSLDQSVATETFLLEESSEIRDSCFAPNSWFPI